MSRNTRHLGYLIAEEMNDHYRYMQLHGWREFTGTLLLADLLAGDRVAIWASASHDNKHGLVLQALRAKEAVFNNDDVEAFVTMYDEKYLGGTQAASVPPAELVTDELQQMAAAQQAAVTEALRDAVKAESAAERTEAFDAAAMHRRELNAVIKARDFFTQGVLPLIDTNNTNDYLVPSSEGNGTVYRIRGGACTCPAGQKERACWRVALVATYSSACDQHAIRRRVLQAA